MTWTAFAILAMFPITSELRKGFTLDLPLVSIHLLSQPVIAGDFDHVGAKKVSEKVFGCKPSLQLVEMFSNCSGTAFSFKDKETLWRGF